MYKSNTNYNQQSQPTVTKFKTVIYKLELDNKFYYAEAYNEKDAKVALIKKIKPNYKSIDFNKFINELSNEDIANSEVYKSIRTHKLNQEEKDILWSKQYTKEVYYSIRKNDTLSEKDLLLQKEKQQCLSDLRKFLSEKTFVKYLSSYNDFILKDESTVYLKLNGMGDDIIPIAVSCNETKNPNDVYRFVNGYIDAYKDLRTRLKRLELDNQLFATNSTNDLTNLEMLDSVTANFNSLDLVKSNNKIINKQTRQVIEYNTKLVLSKKSHLKLNLF